MSPTPEPLLSKSTTSLAWIVVTESSYSFGGSESLFIVGYVSATSAAAYAAEKAFQSDRCKTTKAMIADEGK